MQNGIFQPKIEWSINKAVNLGIKFKILKVFMFFIKTVTIFLFLVSKKLSKSYPKGIKSKEKDWENFRERKGRVRNGGEFIYFLFEKRNGGEVERQYIHIIGGMGKETFA